MIYCTYKSCAIEGLVMTLLFMRMVYFSRIHPLLFSLVLLTLLLILSLTLIHFHVFLMIGWILWRLLSRARVRICLQEPRYLISDYATEENGSPPLTTSCSWILRKGWAPWILTHTETGYFWAPSCAALCRLITASTNQECNRHVMLRAQNSTLPTSPLALTFLLPCLLKFPASWGGGEGWYRWTTYGWAFDSHSPTCCN